MSEWRTHLAKSMQEDVPRPTPYTPSEQDEHRVVAAWLDLHRLVWTHPPMGGKRSRIEAAIMHGMGSRAGVPDVVVFTPPPLIKANGVAIELKRKGRQREKNGGVSRDQEQWLDWLEGCGWFVRVAFGADEAIRWLEGAGYGRRSGAA